MGTLAQTSDIYMIKVGPYLKDMSPAANIMWYTKSGVITAFK